MIGHDQYHAVGVSGCTWHSWEPVAVASWCSPCGKIWRNWQNRKHNVLLHKGGRCHRHCHGSQKIWWSSHMWFVRYMLADRQTDRQTDRQWSLQYCALVLAWRSRKYNTVQYNLTYICCCHFICTFVYMQASYIMHPCLCILEYLTSTFPLAMYLSCVWVMRVYIELDRDNQSLYPMVDVADKGRLLLLSET